MNEYDRQAHRFTEVNEMKNDLENHLRYLKIKVEKVLHYDNAKYAARTTLFFFKNQYKHGM